MKVLFATLDWGLGHATRDIALIRGLLEQKHTVTLGSCGASLRLLKEIFPRSAAVELPAYPSPYRGAGFSILKTLLLSPRFLLAIRAEKKAVGQLVTENDFDLIVSDSRYGMYHRDVPSYLITHQLRFIAPGRLAAGERLAEKFNDRYYRNFKAVIVPDHEKDGLSGDLSHGLKGISAPVTYIGHVTDLVKRDTREDLDYYISLSGPEPQRTRLEELILDQARALSGTVLVALARPGADEIHTRGNLEIHSFVTRSEQAELMNRAKLVISRSGYTTLMELAELRKKALLIPTPGQPEQEYLADLHGARNSFYGIKQSALDLKLDAGYAEQTEGYSPPHGAKESVRKFLQIVGG